MRNCFRKYFLILVFLSLSQQPAQAIEIELPWILGSICAVVKSYLPIFSLPSFFARYHFRRRNIDEQNNINNEENIDANNQDVKQETIEISIPGEIVYGPEHDIKHQKQENTESQNNVINNEYTSDAINAFFDALESACAHKLNEKDKLDAEISKPLHKLSKLLDEIAYLNQKIKDKTYKRDYLNRLKTDLNNKINKKDGLQKKVQEYVNQGANATYLAFLDRIWGYSQKTSSQMLYYSYVHSHSRLARTIETAQNFDYNTTLKKITKRIEETHSINVQNLCKNYPEYAKKYKQYELNAEFLNAIETALMHNFEQEEDLEKIKEYINQGANNVYLQNLFKKEPEYAKKYNQRYEIALLHAVKIAKKNYFKRKEDLEKIKMYVNKGANPDYPIGRKKQTLLMLVSEYGNKDLLDFLLTKEVNINARDINQNTVLHTLAFLYRESYRMLRGYPATIDIASPESCGTGLSISETYILENLLKHGADVNATNSDLETPLLVAINSGNSMSIAGCYPYFIKSLITSTNVNQPDQNKSTPLWHALHNAKRSAKIFCIGELNNFNDFKVLESLYKNGASLINLDKNNNSIFHLLVGIKNRKYLEQHIKAILMHTQDAHKKQDQKWGEKIRDSYLGLTSVNIPLDIQCLIFSFLPNFSDVDIGTIKLLLKNIPKDIPLLYQTMNQMTRIQNALQYRNSSEQTPLQILESKNQKKEGVKDLFDENRPKEDFKNFLQEFPNINKAPEDNWAVITYRYLLQK